MKLLLGTRRYSSWSLRPWLALKIAGVEFEEHVIEFDDGPWRDEVHKHSPSGKVPVLFDGNLVIPESLAIIEYAHDLNPEAGLYPKDTRKRARLRAAACEMHAGFLALRDECPMNFARQATPPKANFSSQCLTDISRIEQIWTDLRRENAADGPYLGGQFGAADCMYAPVVSRIISYGIEINDTLQDYVRAVINTPLMREWIALAARETAHCTETENT